MKIEEAMKCTAHVCCADLSREVLRLRKDKARLDWLERKGFTGYGWRVFSGDICQVTSPASNTPRSAIDAAMRRQNTTAGKRGKK